MVPDAVIIGWFVATFLFTVMVVVVVANVVVSVVDKKIRIFDEEKQRERGKPAVVESVVFDGARCVIIESPYKGDVAANEAYGDRCLADSLKRGEAPFASHLLYTRKGVLDDSIPEERRAGILAGLSIGERMDATVVYIDMGVSGGMGEGIRRASFAGRRIEYRSIGSGE